jgi:hypothetical protein
MVDIKDSGSEFHISRPRIVGLVFSVAASPIWFVSAILGHENLGALLWFLACFGLMIAYIRPTRFSKFMRSLIPTSAENTESSRIDPS